MILRQLKMTEVALQARMNSNLQNCIQTILYQVKQSTEAYQVNVFGYIAWLGVPLFQDARKIVPRLPSLLIL